MKKLDNKIVIVTGASRGIGEEIALSFARQKSTLVLAARSSDGLKRVEQKIQTLGAEVLSVPTDVSSPEAVEALVAKTQARFGRVDILVNNAGIGRVSAVESGTFEADLQDTLQASLFGMVRLTRAVLPLMRTQGAGAIVNMSSVMGRKAFARFGSYAIVMHGVSAFSDALRQELAGSGIHVSLIQPALTATDLIRDTDPSHMPPPFRHMTPLPAAYVAEQVVQAVRQGTPRLVLPRKAEMLVLGEALSPRLGDGIAAALAHGGLARLLRFDQGKTYHEVIANS